MRFNVYLSGEIHTEWRDEVRRGAEAAGLDVEFTAPVTDHPASDAAGDHLGETDSFSGAITSPPRSTPSVPVP